MAYYFEENRWGERFIPDINRDTFRDTRCRDIYEREHDLDLSAKDTLHIVVGSDSGLMLKYLQENLNAPGSCAIVVDKDEFVPYINQEYPGMVVTESAADSPPKVRLFRECAWQLNEELAPYNPWFFKHSTVLHRAHCCYTDYNNLYTRLFRDTRRNVSERQIQLKHSLGLKSFIDTQFQNAADNVAPFVGNSQFGQNKVAVILAGGPSLDEHMDWVMKNREQLFIIAVSRLSKKLLDLELKPDMVVSVDPLQNMYEVSKHGVLWQDVPLINSYHLVPALLQQWQGPRYFIGNRLPWEKFSENTQPSVFGTGPTVSHTGVIVASHLGFSTILLAGADLCFSAVGGTHVKGTPEHALRQLPSGYDAEVTTYSGRTAGTNLALLRSIDAMDALGVKLNQQSAILFNLSEEAVRIDSIPLINKKDIELPTHKPSFDLSIPWAPSTTSLKQLEKELQAARRAFRDIRELCKKALVCIDYIYERDNRQATPAHHKRLKNLESRLIKQDQYTKTIKHYYSNKFLQLQTPAGFQAMKKSEMEAWARSYYGLLKRGACRMLSLINTAEKKVLLRKKELCADTSIIELINNWKEDGTPGRVLHYTRHDYSDNMSMNALCADDRQAVSTATTHYLSSLSETGKQTEHYLTDTKTIINNCINSVMFLFHNENKDELKALGNAISKNIWPNDVLISLIEALISELQADRESAISSYQTTVERCRTEIENGHTEIHTVERLIETALIRQTQCHLSSNNGQDATLPLSELCKDNPHYLCSYARLLEMLGQSEAAIEQVQRYLQLRPNDWRAAQQLSEHYQSIGATESAELALQLASTTRTAAQQHSRIAA